MKRPENIAIDPKTKLPEAWKSWGPLQREAWHIGENQRFKALTGLDLQAIVRRALRSAQVELAIKKHMNSPVFKWNIEMRLRAAINKQLAINGQRRARANSISREKVNVRKAR